MSKLNPNDYKQIFYIDINGNDDGNGTIKNPCKTIKGLLSKIHTEIDTLIYLNEGTYEIDETIFNKGKNCVFSICGKKDKTILKQVQGFFSNSGGGSSSFTCNFYDLIYTAPNITSVNANYIYSKYNFYNVVFKDIKNNSYAFFCSQNEINFYNCVKVEKSDNFLRATGGKINLYGCYGAFTNGYGTIQSMWDKKDNLIVNSPNLDNNFKIINNNNLLYGVYSGDNSWQLSIYLLKQNNKYYSIKEQFYDKQKKVYLPCEQNFEKNGFNDLSQLIKNITIDEEIFKPINCFKGEIEILQAEEK